MLNWIIKDNPDKNIKVCLVFVLSYDVSLCSAFRVVMSVMFSA